MTRVSTFSQGQALLAELMKINARTAVTQNQISTGKTAQHYKDIPSDTEVLLSAKRLLTRTEQYQSSNKEISTRLDMQDLTLGQLATDAQNLRQATLDAISSGSGSGLMESVAGLFQQAVSLLNTQVDGKYVFGGTRTDQPPVTVASLSDLASLPAVSDAFANNSQVPSVEVATGQTMSYGFLADSVGTDLMAAIQRIAQYNAGPNGPFGANLTEAQRTFLTQEVPSLKAAYDNLTAVVSQNGQLQRTLDNIQTQHESSVTRVKTVISDIEDVDMAEAVTRLNMDQTATEATAKMIASMGQLSLLNFLD